MPFMYFEAQILQLNEWKIIRLPGHISKQFPSRGMGMAEVVIGNEDILVNLQPDGMSGHLFRLSEELLEICSLNIGDKVSVAIRVLDEWTEPVMPEDFSAALIACDMEDNWEDLTTTARWEWISWIRSTSDPKIRQERIQTVCSKLEAGMKRPCCFEDTRSSDPDVSKSAVLIMASEE